jgi:DNA mismatch endonuclease (patch repair protein)
MSPNGRAALTPTTATPIRSALGAAAGPAAARSPRDPAVTSRIMSRVRSRDTRPELTLRRAVHAGGGRFRLQARDVPGRPDLVVRTRKVAVFVDGDLWHGNPDEWRRRGHDSLDAMFPTRTDWWVAKIERNVARDDEVNRQLAEQGWRVLRLWASDVLGDPDGAAQRVLALLREQP